MQNLSSMWNKSEREENGFVKASISGGETCTRTHMCTLRATYTHTNRVSVLGLRLRLLWMFSWEITLNKIRPEEFCLYVRVCLWGCVSNRPHVLSPLLNQYVVQSVVPVFMRCTHEHLHVYCKELSWSHVHGCINVIISKLQVMGGHIGWAQFSCASVTLLTQQHQAHLCSKLDTQRSVHILWSFHPYFCTFSES